MFAYESLQLISMDSPDLYTMNSLYSICAITNWVVTIAYTN